MCNEHNILPTTQWYNADIISSGDFLIHNHWVTEQLQQSIGVGTPLHRSWLTIW